MDIYEALIMKATGDMTKEEYWQYMRYNRFDDIL
jgi:hypothetical protein